MSLAVVVSCFAAPVENVLGWQRILVARPMPLDRVARWAGPLPSGVLARLADQPSELSGA